LSSANPEPTQKQPEPASQATGSGLTLKQFIQERLQQQQGKAATTQAPTANEAKEKQATTVWFGDKTSTLNNTLTQQGKAFAANHKYINGATLAQAYLSGTQQPSKHVQALVNKQTHVGAFLNVVDTQHASGIEQYLPTAITRLRVIKQRLEQDITQLELTLQQVKQSVSLNQSINIHKKEAYATPAPDSSNELNEREQHLKSRLAQLRQREQDIEVQMMTLLPRQSLVVKAGVGLALALERIGQRLEKAYALLAPEAAAANQQNKVLQPAFKKAPLFLLWLRSLNSGSCSAWQHLAGLGEELGAIQGLLEKPTHPSSQLKESLSNPSSPVNITWGSVASNKLSPAAQMTLSANEWGNLLVQMDRTLHRLESTQKELSQKRQSPLGFLNSWWLQVYKQLFHG
jgi:hypothetical protein